MADNSDNQVIAASAEGIRKSFSGPEGRIPVLDTVSIQLPSRSFTSIIGPSGCGKTTFVKIMVGLVKPDSGSVSVRQSPQDPRQSMAYMPQSDTLLPWRTALDNSILALQVEGVSLAAARDQGGRMMARFGLSGFESLYPSQLSGGMKQRLALIRTFLARREVLLLDEPLGSLDALTRSTVQDWLLEVWVELGKTILLVTHDVEEASMLSDTVYLFSQRPARVLKTWAIIEPRPRSRSSKAISQAKESILSLIHKVATND